MIKKIFQEMLFFTLTFFFTWAFFIITLSDNKLTKFIYFNF